MEITVTELPGPTTAVRLAGRPDAGGAERIGLHFTAAVATQARHAVVDLSGVEFIASMGIRLLISTARALGLKHHKMVLYGVNKLVQGVLDDAAIGQIIPIVGTEAQAVAELAA